MSLKDEIDMLKAEERLIENNRRKREKEIEEDREDARRRATREITNQVKGIKAKQQEEQLAIERDFRRKIDEATKEKDSRWAAINETFVKPVNDLEKGLTRLLAEADAKKANDLAVEHTAYEDKVRPVRAKIKDLEDDLKNKAAAKRGRHKPEEQQA